MSIKDILGWMTGEDLVSKSEQPCAEDEPILRRRMPPTSERGEQGSGPNEKNSFTLNDTDDEGFSQVSPIKGRESAELDTFDIAEIESRHLDRGLAAMLKPLMVTNQSHHIDWYFTALRDARKRREKGSHSPTLPK